MEPVKRYWKHKNGTPLLTEYFPMADGCYVLASDYDDAAKAAVEMALMVRASNLNNDLKEQAQAIIQRYAKEGT